MYEYDRVIRMKQKLIHQLEEISQEERIYLNDHAAVQKEIYTRNETFEIDSKKFIKENRLITIRTHSRFVDFPVHRHNYIEIMYVCQGTITHCIEGKEIVMNQGDILLLNQQVMHGVKKAGEKDIGINFIALPEFFDIPRVMLKEHNIIADFLLNIFQIKHQEPHYLLFRLKNNVLIENLMENMIYSLKDEKVQEDNQNEDVINQYYMGIVFLYLVNHMDTLQQNSSKSYKDIAVEATLKYIDSMYRTANLRKVATDFNLSESSLSKIIKHYTGRTFQDHLLEKRFQQAQSLLRETDIAIDEISISVGYENVSFFYRKFKQLFGLTPREYRIH